MSTTTSSSSARKKRISFSSSSFKKPGPPALAAPHMSAEQATNARKAAASQWLARGIGEVVVPTKRPTPQQSLPPDHPVQLPASAAASPKDGGIVSTPIMLRSPSRFKVEAAAARRNGNSTGRSFPLIYDEFELSGFRAHMADLVDRLQQKQKSNPQCAEAAEDKKVTSTPVAPVAPQPIAPVAPRPSAPVSSALHKFFNKVNFISSIMKGSKKSAPALRVPAMPNEAPLDDEVNDQEDVQYHYHHYIHHHHHHHYHYGPSPDKVGAVLRHDRRHSESSEVLRPYIPSLWKAVEDEDDDEVGSPIKAFVDTPCRRHSDDFLRGCYMQRKDQDSKHAGEFAMMGESVIRRKDEDSNNHADKFAMMGESVVKSSPQLPRNNSARFTTPKKVHAPGHGNRMSKEKGLKDIEGRIGRQSRKSFQESIHTSMEDGRGSGNGGAYDSIPRTRRHSAEIMTEVDHHTTTQRVPYAPPQWRHSETYDAGYRASVIERAMEEVLERP